MHNNKRIWFRGMSCVILCHQTPNLHQTYVSMLKNVRIDVEFLNKPGH